MLDDFLGAVAEGLAWHVSSRWFLLLLSLSLIVGGLFFTPTWAWLIACEAAGLFLLLLTAKYWHLGD